MERIAAALLLFTLFIAPPALGQEKPANPLLQIPSGVWQERDVVGPTGLLKHEHVLFVPQSPIVCQVGAREDGSMEFRILYFFSERVIQLQSWLVITVVEGENRSLSIWAMVLQSQNSGESWSPVRITAPPTLFEQYCAPWARTLPMEVQRRFEGLWGIGTPRESPPAKAPEQPTPPPATEKPKEEPRDSDKQPVTV